MAIDSHQLGLYEALTPLQRDICRGYLAGMKPVEAYRQSRHGRAKKDNTIASSCCEIMKNPNVKAFLELVIGLAVEDIKLEVKHVVRGLCEEAGLIPGRKGETTPSSRVAALSKLTDHTGGFDKNKQAIELGTKFDAMSIPEMQAFLKAGMEKLSECE